MGFLTPEVMEVGLSLMEGLSCARSLSVAILMRHNEWDQLVELQVEPANYVNADDFWRANVATSLFSKCGGLPVSYTPERLERDAIALFLENEKQCHRTNIRLEPLFWGRASADYPEPLFDFFERVKKNTIRCWPLPVPRLNQREVWARSHHERQFQMLHST